MVSQCKAEKGSSAQTSGCLSCYLNALCIPHGLDTEEASQLDRIANPPLRLEKRQVLVEQDAPFTSLHVVRTGSLKQETAMERGESLMTALWLPGDIIGCDAIGAGRYPGTISALETSTLCELPFDRLEELSIRLPKLRHRLQSTISQAIHEERLRLHQLLCRTAEARIACFLLAVSDGFRRRGCSPRQFYLAMSRSDIGSYLGLSQETVGRILGAYQQRRLLQMQGREFHLLDLAQLEELASSTGRRQKRA